MREIRARKDDSLTNAETSDKATSVAEQGANVAPEKAPSKQAATQRKRAPKAKKAAKAIKGKAAATKKEAKVPGAAQKDLPKPASTRKRR
jgi:hypothetical protein